MRKTGSILFLLLCLSQIVAAKVVTPDVAARCADVFMGKGSVAAPYTLSARVNGRGDVSTLPDYYVFNNSSGGWVIIAADDRVQPVIAYSEWGEFNVDELPSNVEWWMDGVSDAINEVRESDIEADARVREAWNRLLDVSGAPESQKKEIKTALWNQSSPYNIYSPIVAGENKRAYAGCVATAMAIVARHNQWPSKGNGLIGGYYTDTYSTYIPAYSIDEHVYDWSNMPVTDAAKSTSAWTSQQIQEVAQLMHDCGVMVNMDYTYSYGSGTYAEIIREAMQEHLSYPASLTFVYRSGYSADEWYKLMCDEIDQNRVILYSGAGSSGGHAFVCDGYDMNGQKLHFNWGWGGSYNGFYTLVLRLTKDTAFDEGQSALVGITAGTDVDLPGIPSLAHAVDYDRYGIIPMAGSDMVKGAEVGFTAGWFGNMTGKDATFDFKVCLMDSAGEVRQEGWTFSLDLPGNGSFRGEDSQVEMLEVTPALTDYFKLFYKVGESDWKPVFANSEEFPDADGICCGVTHDPIIVIKGSCAAGQEIGLELTPGFAPVTSVSWFINDDKIDGNRIQLESGKNRIRAEVGYYDGSAGTIFKTITVE